MSLDFREITINFDNTSGRKQRESATAVFGSAVRKAQAVLKGFHVGYTDSDHPLWKLEVDLDVERITGAAVTVAADYLLRDSSGNIDDRFGGWIQVVVMADVA
jgi:hypothetical protein